MRGLFVTGTGTEVGKTVVAAVIARNLAKSRSKTLGVVLPDLAAVVDQSFFTEALKGVYSETSRQGYRLLLELATPQFLSRRFFFSYNAICFGLFWLSRMSESAMLSALRRMGFNTLSAVVVGSGKNLEAVLSQLKAHSEWGYRVVGVLGGVKEAAKASFRSLGPASRCESVLPREAATISISSVIRR